jgi:hypothetical protein
MPRRSTIRMIAIALLSTSAFGSIVVGGTLLWAQITASAAADPSFVGSPVPSVILGYGVVSLVGAVGVWLHWPWVVPVVIVSQGLAAAYLLGFSAFVVADWSLLVVGAIAAGAALCVGWLAVTARRA